MQKQQPSRAGHGKENAENAAHAAKANAKVGKQAHHVYAKPSYHGYGRRNGYNKQNNYNHNRGGYAQPLRTRLW